MLTITELRRLLKQLADDRPVFHSEADFQHSLAWSIRAADHTVRLEVPIGSDAGHVDILVDGSIPIELKYKTKLYVTEVDDESFHLRNHSAHYLNRYDVIKDIWRIEQMISELNSTRGYVVFLTNDPSYWNLSNSKRQPNDAEFRLHEGRTLEGTMRWLNDAKPGPSRESPLMLRGNYEAKWHEYPRIDESKAGELRYLLIEVEG